MRKITIADFGKAESDKYARLQTILESVWTAHHESKIVERHARVNVATTTMGGERFQEAVISSSMIDTARFLERMDMAHYQDPLRRLPIACYTPPIHWKYFPIGWSQQHKMISLEEDQWKTMQSMLQSYAPASNLRQRQHESLSSFVDKALCLVRWSVQAILNRARYQGA